MDRHKTQWEKKHENGDREVLDGTVVELRRKLYHGNLPSEASKPKECKDKSDAVQLMVNQFVVLVNLKDKGVVHIVATENLHCKSRGKQYEADDWREVIRVHRWENHVPVSGRLVWRTDTQKDEETC